MNWLKKELKAQAGNAHPIVKIAAGFAAGVLAMGICKMIGLSSEVARPVAAGVAAFVAFVAWDKVAKRDRP